MGGGARRPLIAAALAVAASAAAAQNPPAPTPAASPPARDTVARRQIFNEVFAPGARLPSYLTLDEGVVYRIEIQPAEARVAIRVRRHPALPPLLMVPLSAEAAENTTAAYLIVPRSSDEYRIDVATVGDEPVRVRIWTDPQEGARFARIHEEGFRLPLLGAGLHAVYLASFRDVYGSSLDSRLGYNTTPQAALGIGTCLAVLPNGRLLPDRVGGCALTLEFWGRGGGRSFYTLGLAPEYVVRRTAKTALALSPRLEFGNTTGGKPTAQYTVIGVGARYTLALTAATGAGLQLEAALVDIRSLPSSPDPRRVSSITLFLGAGFATSLR